MSMKYKYTPLIIIVHMVLILLAYSSPFWLDWRLIAVGVILNFIQLSLVGGCVLSHAQFEDRNQTFHEWYLSKLGIKIKRKPFNFVLRYVVPFIILGSAILIQIFLQVDVAFNL